MRIVTFNPQAGGDALDQAASALAGEAARRGHETVSVEIAPGGDGRWTEVHARAVEQAVRAADPHVVLAPVPRLRLERLRRTFKPVAWRLMSVYVVIEKDDGGFIVRNLFTTKRRAFTVDTVEAAFNLIEVEVMALMGIRSADVLIRPETMTVLAETVRELNRLADVEPKLAGAARPASAAAVGGEVETPAINDIVAAQTMWVKGWIDWDASRHRSLDVRLNGRRGAAKVTDFRSDVHALGDAANPLNFEAELVLDPADVVLRVDLSIVDRKGLRRLWRSRRVWLDTPAAHRHRTPIVTGWGRVEGDRIFCDPRCGGRRPRRVSAYQAGVCVGAWAAETSSLAENAPIVFDAAPLEDSASLIHIYVCFDDRPPAAWLALDPATGAPADPASTPVETRSAVESDAFAPPTPNGHDLDLSRVFVNGKPAVGAASYGSVDLGGQSGSVLVDVESRNGGTTTHHALRLCRDAYSEGRLPIIVAPPAARSAAVVSRSGPARVVLLRRAAAPTDDLYVLSAFQSLAEHGRVDFQVVDLDGDDSSLAEREALLVDGAWVIVSRYLTREWLQSIMRRRERLSGLYYVIDDDLALAEDDRRLPTRYRHRMTGTAHGEFQALLHLAHRVVVTSPWLKARYDSDKTDLLEPPYLQPPANLDHLDDTAEIRVAYHGTLVHRDDVAAIAPAIRAVHDAYEHVSFELLMGKMAPPELSGLERVRVVKEMLWDEYKEMASNTRAHIGLAPMLNTPYNAGKSFVKILDTARLGAVGLYSRRDPFRDRVTHGENGFLLDNDPEVWRRALAWLIENPSEIRRTARAAQDLAHTIGDVARVSAYWEAQMLADTSGHAA